MTEEMNTEDNSPTVVAIPNPINISQQECPNVKYDWYQTQTHITVNILIKNVDKEHVKIEYREQSFTATFSKDGYNLNLNLARKIVPTKCSFHVTQSKIEIKLKKHDEELWPTLESVCEKLTKQMLMPNKRNWDKLVQKELEGEKPEGEAAVNELFHKIYSEGSDEVKKAMNKSFLESGGTVLSTNWNEVGEKKIDIKPPDGMEWKTWDS